MNLVSLGSGVRLLQPFPDLVGLGCLVAEAVAVAGRALDEHEGLHNF